MTRIHPEVTNWLLENNRGEISSSAPVGGGCIHQALLLQTSTNERYFLKQNFETTADMFEKEARGLNTLRISGGPGVPKVFLVGKAYLLLEDLQASSPCEDFWQLFGRQLALIHNQVNEAYGFQEDNYIGANPQQNTWMENGHDFFRERRLKPQIQLTHRQSFLTAKDIRMLEELLVKLTDLVPEQPASLIHGDLWSGNLMTDKEGKPAIIDPAVHYGWAEADLAMTDLFGRFPDSFYDAYIEVRPLEPGYRSRYPIYNLYHLLNHLNLFGGGYLSQVRQIISRYA